MRIQLAVVFGCVAFRAAAAHVWQADGLPPSMAAVDQTTERLVAEVLQSADGIAAAAASSGGQQANSQQYSQQQQQRYAQQYNEQQQYGEQQPMLQQQHQQKFSQQQQRFQPSSKVSPTKGLQAGALTAGGGRRHGKHAATALFSKSSATQYMCDSPYKDHHAAAHLMTLLCRCTFDCVAALVSHIRNLCAQTCFHTPTPLSSVLPLFMAGSPGSSPNQQHPYAASHFQPIKSAAVASAPTSPYRQRGGPAISPQRPAAAAAADGGGGGGISSQMGGAVRFAVNSSGAGSTPSRGGTAGVAAAAATGAAAAGRAAAGVAASGGGRGAASPRIDGKEFFRQARWVLAPAFCNRSLSASIC